MRITSRTYVVPCLAVALAFGACGGDDDSEGDESGASEETAVLATVADFTEGAIAGDGARACGALTEDALAQLEGAVSGVAEGQGCEDAVAQLGELATDEMRQAAAELEPTVSEISGSSAVVETESLSLGEEGIEREDVEIELVKEGDDWKISKLPENPQA